MIVHQSSAKSSSKFGKAGSPDHGWFENIYRLIRLINLQDIFVFKHKLNTGLERI